MSHNRMATLLNLFNAITLEEAKSVITPAVMSSISGHVAGLHATGFLEIARDDKIAQRLIDLLGLEYSQHLKNMYFQVKSLIDEYEEARVDADWVNPNFWSRQYDGVQMLAYYVFGKIKNFDDIQLTDFFDAGKKWTLTPDGDRYIVKQSH